MPIRFRCAFCNQLMGIAVRKAGSVVRCPKCTGQVVVPDPGGKDAADDDADANGVEARDDDLKANGGLFEESNFEKMFVQEASPQLVQESMGRGGTTRHPQPANPGVVQYDAIPLGPEMGESARGLLLTPGVIAILCGLVVVLMGMAFFLGLLLGRS